MIRKIGREILPLAQAALDRLINKINEIADVDFHNYVEKEVTLNFLTDTLITHGLNKVGVRWLVVQADAGGVPYKVAYAATDNPQAQIRMRSDGTQNVTLRFF